MLTINLFILRKSVNHSVNLFSNRNMNSATDSEAREALESGDGGREMTLEVAEAYK